jgi:hypothetical protein
MAKQVGGSRSNSPRASRAARQAGDRRDSEIAREEVLAGEAADVLATNATLRDADAIADIVEDHVAAPDDEPSPDERARHAEDVQANAGGILEGLRRSITRHGDFRSLPKMRGVGRVVHVLTVSRQWPSCTGGEVFRVFLEEIPDRLPANHRQSRRTSEEIDVTESSGARAIYRRLERLVNDGYATTTATTVDDKYGQYVMNDLGRIVFWDWPSDVQLSLEVSPRRVTRRPSINRVTHMTPQSDRPQPTDRGL